jgi:peptidyl-prolyl cis-trans isomerase D
LRAKATEMVEKINQGGKLADQATAAGVKVETAEKFKRDATVPNLPAGAVAGAFRTAKDAAGQSEGASATEWVVFRVTDVAEPALDLASEDTKKLKASVERGLADELVGQYVVKMENEIGVTINQPAVAQITGAAN